MKRNQINFSFRNYLNKEALKYSGSVFAIFGNEKTISGLKGVYFNFDFLNWIIEDSLKDFEIATGILKYNDTENCEQIPTWNDFLLLKQMIELNDFLKCTEAPDESLDFWARKFVLCPEDCDAISKFIKGKQS